jgi:hypothetical protein
MHYQMPAVCFGLIPHPKAKTVMEDCNPQPAFGGLTHTFPFWHRLLFNPFINLQPIKYLFSFAEL